MLIHALCHRRRCQSRRLRCRTIGAAMQRPTACEPRNNGSWHPTACAWTRCLMHARLHTCVGTRTRTHTHTHTHVQVLNALKCTRPYTSPTRKTSEPPLLGLRSVRLFAMCCEQLGLLRDGHIFSKAQMSVYPKHSKVT